MASVKKIGVIGSGFSGLAAATALASKGNEVHVFEKNETIGGRARNFQTNGFTFDMGPSWYWMPDVMERFFNTYGKSSRDYYELKKLDPAYRIYFEGNEYIDIPNNMEDLTALFESIETGAGKKLKKFLYHAKQKYDIALANLIYKPSYSWLEFATPEVLKNIFKLNLLQSYHGYVRQYFKNSKLIRIMEFPILFLGALPQNTPSLYSMMNYAGLQLGTWYPMGGFFEIIKAMQSLAESKGVTFHSNTPIEKINIQNHKAVTLTHPHGDHAIDGVIAGADYHFVEQQLLEKKFRNYKEDYWSKRTMAPSCLIYYLGIDKKLNNLQHHNLFFDEDFGVHAKTIYQNPSWPDSPLFYVCCPSKTDSSVAPEGKENLFLLIPIASGIEESDALKEKYLDVLIDRIKKNTGEDIREHIIFKRSYCVKDFANDYNAYKGNAYGLANTLKQTAVWKPTLKNKMVSNLFYTGQLTVPGPGVPPAIISGQIAANELTNFLNKQ